MNKVSVLVEGYSKSTEDSSTYEVVGTCTLIQGDDLIVVADPGMVTDRAKILDELTQERVSPDDVTHVFISHHHPDHTVNIALFPNAEVVDYHAAYKGEIWQYHEGNQGEEHQIAPGITVLLTPGHTEEDSSLIVETDEGTYALTHAWYSGDRTDDPLAEDPEKLQESREQINAIANLKFIIPGHGSQFSSPGPV